jgi:hypothetical protein
VITTTFPIMSSDIPIPSTCEIPIVGAASNRGDQNGRL